MPRNARNFLARLTLMSLKSKRYILDYRRDFYKIDNYRHASRVFVLSCLDAWVENGLMVAISGLDLGLSLISRVMFHDRPTASIFITIFQFIPNQERFHGVLPHVKFR